jgi:hypothetical protein
VTNAAVYNNTIYVGEGERVDQLLYSDWGGWPDGMFFYNSIFHVEGAAQFSYGVRRRADGAYKTAPGLGPSKNNAFDSNVYYQIQPVNDSHALITDPMLTAPGRGRGGGNGIAGYTLGLGSPAADSGRIVENNGGRDFFGTAVPSCGGVDRGAVESKTCTCRSAPMTRNECLEQALREYRERSRHPDDFADLPPKVQANILEGACQIQPADDRLKELTQAA